MFGAFATRVGRRAVSVGAGGGAAAIALLMILAPAASAANYGVGTHYSPFSGTALAKYTLYQQGGCGHSKIVKSIFFSAKTGIGGWAATTSAKACAKHLGTVGANAFGVGEFAWDLAFPVHLPSGTHSFDANITATISAMEAITVKGSCPSAASSGSGFVYQECIVEAESFATAQLQLLDSTNGTVVGFAFSPIQDNFSEVFNFSYCSGGSCSSSNSSTPSTMGSFTGTITGDVILSPTTPLKSTHTYVLDLLVQGGAISQVYTYPQPGYVGSTAVAIDNVGTLGNGVTLNWLSIA